MANWKNTLDIFNEFQSAKDYEIAPQQLAKVIAEKLQQITPPDFLQDDFELVLDNFLWLSEQDDDADFTEQFDTQMTDLYDIADSVVDNLGSRFIWVKTC